MLILLGFLVGLGLWAFGLTLVYALPACLFVFFRFWMKGRGDSQFFRAMSWVILGGLIGALPWLLYAAQHGVENLLAELSGGAIAGVENLSWFSQVGQHLVNLLLLGSTALFGIRPPWEVRWLALPLIPLILFFWIWVIVFMRRSLRKGGPDRSVRVLLMGIGLTLSLDLFLPPLELTLQAGIFYR